MKKIILWIIIYFSLFSFVLANNDFYFASQSSLTLKNDFSNLNDRWKEISKVYDVPNFAISSDNRYIYYNHSINSGPYWSNLVKRDLITNTEVTLASNICSYWSCYISLSEDDRYLYYNSFQLDIYKIDLTNNNKSLLLSNSYAPLVNWDYLYYINRWDNFHVYRKNLKTWNTNKYLNISTTGLFFYKDHLYFNNPNDYTIRKKLISDTNSSNLWDIIISNVLFTWRSNNHNFNLFLYSLRSNSNQTLIYNLDNNSSNLFLNFWLPHSYYFVNKSNQYCRTELLNFQYPTLYDDVFNNSELVNNPNYLHSDKTKVINYLSDYSYSSWIITWKINWSIWSPINYEENQWLVISTHNTKLQWITINWSHSDFDYFYLAYQDKKTFEPKRLKPLENWWSWRRFKFSDDIINLRWYEELVDTFVYIIFENTKFNSTYQINNLKLYQYSPQFYDTKVCYKINLSDFWLKTDSNNNIIDENWKKYDINKKWELVDENGKIITQIQDINYNWEDKKIEDIYDYNWQLEQEIKNEIEDEKKQIDNEFIKKIFWENWSIILTSLLDQLIFDSEKIKENNIQNVPIPNIENNKLNYDTKIDIKVQMPKPITIYYKARIEPNAWELFIVTIICIIFIIFKAAFIVIYFLPLLTISKFASFIQSYILPHLSSNNFWWNWISFISYILYFSWLIVLFYLFFAFISPFYTIISLVQNASWIFLYNISLFLNWWNYFLWLLELFFAWIYTVIILYIAYVLSLKFWRVN